MRATRSSLHVGAGLVGVLLLASAAACGSEDQPQAGKSTSAPPSSASVSPAGSVAPGATAVPLAGDSHARVAWKLAPGVNATDPRVDVARRSLVLVYLAGSSPAWRGTEKTRDADTALTTGGVVTTRKSGGDTGTRRDFSIRVLMQPVERRTGTSAVAWACIADLAQDSPTKVSVLGNVSLRLVHGTWKASGYSLSAKDDATDRSHERRCDSFT